jgi:hypothetical protein
MRSWKARKEALEGDVRKVAIGGSKSSVRDRLTTGLPGDIRPLTAARKCHGRGILDHLLSRMMTAFRAVERFVDLGTPMS